MVGILRIECSRRIVQPVMKDKIPVRPYILGMQNADMLFNLTTHKVTKLRIWLCCVHESRVCDCESKWIKRMETCIPSRFAQRRIKKGPDSITIVSNLNHFWLNRHSSEIVTYRRVKATVTGCIEVAKPDIH